MNGLGGVGNVILHESLMEHAKSVEVLVPNVFVDACLGKDVGALVIRRARDEAENLVIVAFV